MAKQLIAKTFKVHSIINCNSFPELTDNDLKLRYDNTNKIGVCFSGGGARSFACSLGQMRALHALKLLPQIGCISAVSGGAWFATLFSFSKFGSISENLGDVIAPNDLSVTEVSKEFDNKCLGSVIPNLINSKVLKSIFENNEKYGSKYAYSRMLNDLLLKPFQLNESKFFTMDKTTQDEIVNTNSRANLKFYTMREMENGKMPMLIINCTQQNVSDMDIDTHLFEMTPMYVGTPQKYTLKDGNKKLPFGGGFIQPYAFNLPIAENSYSNDNKIEVYDEEQQKFTLSDMMGSSGCVYGEFVNKYMKIFSSFSPQFTYLSPNPSQNEEISSFNYKFVDGGSLENTGIVPLLQRQYKTIFAFINSPVTLTKINDLNGGMDSQISRLFGPEVVGGSPKSILKKTQNVSVPQFEHKEQYSTYRTLIEKLSNLENTIESKIENSEIIAELKEFNLKNIPLKIEEMGTTDIDIQVFKDDQHEHFQNLKKAFHEAKKDGRAIIFTDTYEIKDNNYFNISPVLPTNEPYKVKVTWVYNHINNNWKKQLNDELKKLLESNDSYGGFSNFPNFNTAFQNIYRVYNCFDDPEILLLTTEQVKMLAHMHCYSIMSNADKFE